MRIPRRRTGRTGPARPGPPERGGCGERRLPSGKDASRLALPLADSGPRGCPDPTAGRRGRVFRACGACDNPATMPLDDRFDDLVASLAGFYRAWVIQLGIELDLFARLREAGPAGLTRAALAA